MRTPWLRYALSAAATASFLAACGGGGSDDHGNRAPVTQVIALGDSLADNGTFGIRATVQGVDTDGQPFKVWPEHVAAAYGTSLCPHYRAVSSTVFEPNDSCRNYAVGGAQINPLGANGQSDSTTPRSLLRQIEDAAEQGIADDALVLVVGGANDAATLVKAAIGALTGNSTALMTLLSSRVSAQQLQAYFADGQQAGITASGAHYMEQLAKDLAQQLQRHVLDNGKTRIALLNILDITQTPQFVGALQQIAQQADAQTANSVRTLAQSWVQVYNDTLTAELGHHSRVALVDFQAQFQQQLSRPSDYGYTNTTLPTCALAGLADENLADCTSTLLSSVRPAGATDGNWWQRYMFSNSFHPTPYGHQQMANFVLEDLRAQGWK